MTKTKTDDVNYIVDMIINDPMKTSDTLVKMASQLVDLESKLKIAVEALEYLNIVDESEINDFHRDFIKDTLAKIRGEA